MTRHASQFPALGGWSGLLLAAALAVPGSAAAQSKEFSRTVSLERGGELILTATKGSVRLTAWDRNEVEVRARIEATEWHALGDHARQSVDATTVDVDATPRSVAVRSNYDGVPSYRRWLGGWSREIPSIHYVITAPARVSLRLNIDRSDTELRGFEGRLNLDLDRSELTARDLRGSIDLVIDRGGRSELTNVSGTIALDADRTDVWIDAARLEAASRITADRGDIELHIPSSQALGVRADLGRRGTFRSDLAIARTGDLSLPRRSRRDSRIEGTINGGGPELLVRGDRTTFLLRSRR
jgi:hypothetical protein